MAPVVSSLLLVCAIALGCRQVSAIKVAESGLVDPIDGSSYLLLSDDEILHDGDLLKELVTSSKEEIEDLVDENPEIQAALLDKVKSVIKTKTKVTSAADFITSATAEQQKQLAPLGMPVVVVDANTAAYNKQSKLNKLKAKLANKTAKLFRIAAPLKSKIMGMMRKKLRKKLKKLLKKAQQKLEAQEQQQQGAVLVGYPATKIIVSTTAKPTWHVSFSGKG